MKSDSVISDVVMSGGVRCAAHGSAREPRVDAKKTAERPLETYTGYGRVTYGENLWVKVKARSFREATTKLRQEIRDQEGRSRGACTYLEFAVRDNLQLVDETRDGCSLMEPEDLRSELIKDFEKEVQRQYELIFRSGILGEREDSNDTVLLKIAIRRAAQEVRLLHPDHQELERRLSHV